MYELIEATEIRPAILIRHNEDGTDTFIPLVNGNADYQRYLKWVENPDAEEQVLPFPTFTELLSEEPIEPPNYEQTQEGAE
jgi:hypothetical protein